jgi:SNF2 family DNA or RNA helicase
MKTIKLKKEPKTASKIDAFPFQIEAFNSLKDLDYAAVFHEQGLGKTKIAIDLLLHWLASSLIDTVLIVTKKQLVHNWQREFIAHTYIKPAVLNIDKHNNRYVFLSPARVIITNFEVLQTEKMQFKLFLSTRNVAIVVDESAKLKNPDTKLTKTYFEFAKLFKKRLILTGTPVANRPYDIWAQIYFLDGGKSLGDSFYEFKSKTDLSNKLSSDIYMQKAFEHELSRIFNKISHFSVRETKIDSIIELPAKVFIKEKIELFQNQRILYNQIRDELKIDVIKFGEKIIDDSTAIVKRLLRLVQVVSNPKLVDESYLGKSAKEDVLKKLVDFILSNGEKCIVWTNFIENVDYFHKSYSHTGAVKIHGKMKIIDRNRSVEKFNLPDYKILFATPASAKEGLTLTQANHVIFYDRGFSLDDYLQAQDRIHRISQSKTCYIYNIIANNTIDEWINILLEAKHKAASLVQGDISLEVYRKKADYSFGSIIKEILNIQEDKL